MSSSDQPVVRMTMRGGGKEKMSKAVANLHSGGMEDFEQEESKAAGKKGRRPKFKKADMEITPKMVDELAALEDQFMEASHSAYPCHWTDEVSGNITFSKS
jgi:hypothetical protein